MLRRLRLICVVVKFVLLESAAFNRAEDDMNLNYGWVDYDDNVEPSKVDINRSNLVIWRSDRTKAFKIFPRELTYQAEGSNGKVNWGGIRKAGWCNTTYDEIEFLGLKTKFTKPSSRSVGSHTPTPTGQGQQL